MFATVGVLSLTAFLVFCAIGIVKIIGMFFSFNIPLTGKKILIGMGISFVLFIIGIAMTPSSDEDTKKAEKQTTETTTSSAKKPETTTTEKKPEATTKQKKKEKATEKSKEPNPFDSGVEKYYSNKYPYITNADLEKYAPNMEGVKVYTVITISEFDDGKIKASLSDDGFMFSTFDVGDRFDSYEKVLKEDDTVAILGVVDKLSDYGFMGNSVALKDCYVFTFGETAEKCDLGKTSKKLSKYLKTTEETAKSSDVSEDEYISLCKTYNHEDILRNPDSYKKKYCQISGSVNQIIEGFFDTFTIYVEDSNGDLWECTYTYDKGETRLLEGDAVTMYGTCSGTTTSTTLLGKQVTLPSINVEYIN